MQTAFLQILEVRAGENPGRCATVTAAVASDASRAIAFALSEQLDRRRQAPIESTDDVVELRQDIALTDRFEALAATGVHGVVSLSIGEVRACLVSLTRYVDRVDGDHFQPTELRDRLRVIAAVVPILWEANATSSALGAGDPVAEPAQP